MKTRRQFMKLTGLAALVATCFGKIGKADPYMGPFIVPKGVKFPKAPPGIVIKVPAAKCPLEKGDMAGTNGDEDGYLVFNKWDGDNRCEIIIWDKFRRDKDGSYKQVGTVKTDWRGLRI